MQDGGNRLHPTQKPLKLFNELVQIHSNMDDLVVDPFLGSGTSAIAAVGNKRQFTGGDINPYYVQVAMGTESHEISAHLLRLS